MKQIMAEVEEVIDDSKASLPRVWWIGSGLATALPFHAAGEHQPGSTDNVLSKAISSYAPSMRFLSYSRGSRTANDSMPLDRVLIVSMSSTPEYPDLPNVYGEGSLIKDLGSQVQIENPEEEPTAKQVAERIKKCTIAHLACHGHVDHPDPLKCGLVFKKSRTNWNCRARHPYSEPTR